MPADGDEPLFPDRSSGLFITSCSNQFSHDR